MLHGFMSSNAQWSPNIAALSQHHYLITVELWGHGGSPLPADPAMFTIEAYAAQFEDIREQLGINEWSLIGQSYGAGLVLNYACTHQSVCRAVVVTNSRSAFGNLPAARDGSRQAPGIPEDLRKLPYHPIHARRFPDTIKAALVKSADAMDAQAVRLGGALGARLNCRELVIDYPLPMLITNGVYEKSFQKDLASLRTRAPDLNVVDLEGGHSVNIEAAERFNEAVLDFLQLST